MSAYLRIPPYPCVLQHGFRTRTALTTGPMRSTAFTKCAKVERLPSPAHEGTHIRRRHRARAVSSHSMPSTQKYAPDLFPRDYPRARTIGPQLIRLLQTSLAAETSTAIENSSASSGQCLARTFDLARVHRSDQKKLPANQLQNFGANCSETTRNDLRYCRGEGCSTLACSRSEY